MNYRYCALIVLLTASVFHTSYAPESSWSLSDLKAWGGWITAGSLAAYIIYQRQYNQKPPKVKAPKQKAVSFQHDESNSDAFLKDITFLALKTTEAAKWNDFLVDGPKFKLQKQSEHGTAYVKQQDS